MSSHRPIRRYICFDTCVLVDCALCLIKDTRPDLLDAIFQRMDEVGATLLMIDVVDAELDNVMKRREEDFAHSLNTIRESVKRIAVENTLPANSKNEILSAIENVKQSTRKNGKDLVDRIRTRATNPEKGLLLRFCTEDIEEAIRMSIAGKHPAKAKHGDGLVQADCLIAACLKRHKKDHPDSEVIFCSSNIADFAKTDGGGPILHPDLDEYWAGAVRYFSDPNDLHKWLASLEGELTEEEESELEDYSKAYESTVRFSEKLMTSTFLNYAELYEAIHDYRHSYLHEATNTYRPLRDALSLMGETDVRSSIETLADIYQTFGSANNLADIMDDARSQLDLAFLSRVIDKDLTSIQAITSNFADIYNQILLERITSKLPSNRRSQFSGSCATIKSETGDDHSGQNDIEDGENGDLKNPGSSTSSIGR